MEDAAKDQSSHSESGAKSSARLLRYPLRSATKSKAEKPEAVESSNPSASKRGRPAPSVSKSVGVLDLSGKEKPVKPPRRLSIPTKPSPSPAPKQALNITPISEARWKRSINNQDKNNTPMSEISMSSSRRKFNVLSSASYWLTQIKLSETAAKHSVSLGFFKLALEAGCEPIQRMRDELKSYTRRHNLVEHGELVKQLFETYNMENSEQFQVSETCSHVPEDGTRSSDDDVHSSSSVAATHNVKPKLLNNETTPIKESVKEIAKKSSAIRVSRSMSKNSGNLRSSEAVGGNRFKKTQKPIIKQVGIKEKDKVKKQAKKSVHEEGPNNPLSQEDPIEENKENMDAPQMEEISLAEV